MGPRMLTSGTHSSKKGLFLAEPDPEEARDKDFPLQEAQTDKNIAIESSKVVNLGYGTTRIQTCPQRPNTLGRDRILDQILQTPSVWSPPSLLSYELGKKQHQREE
jgi:hypothetical protein